jgi:Tfp pilus assembly protein PilW
MKTLIAKSSSTARHRTGFTLVETMITMVTMMIVIGAAMAAYIYGLRIVQFTKPKLGASDEARQAISLMTDEIRSARSIKIGSGDISSFTEVSPFSLQVGSALQVYPSTNTSQYIRYFWDQSDGKLKRTTNGMTSTYVVANCISNYAVSVFTAEDYNGTTLTNNFNNRVIAMTLQFYQIQYPQMQVGPGNYYDFYQLRAKFTRRTLL